MNPTSWQHIHFTGIGGVGMSGLAHILLDWGIKVTGSDQANSKLFQSLLVRGADLTIGSKVEKVAGAELLIYSSAVLENDAERMQAKKLRIPQMRRGEFLAKIAPFFKKVVAISGSHGKTTTAAMLTHILKSAGVEAGFMIGAEVLGFERSAAAGDSSLFITEVDESDGTQAFMKSDLSMVLNIEDDHCWSVGGVEALEDSFVTFANSAKSILVWESESCKRLLGEHPNCTLVNDDFIPENLKLKIPGEHNKIDATMAMIMAIKLGVDAKDAVTALNNFQGVARRMNMHYQTPKIDKILIEDYAHHPTEVKATIAGLRKAYPQHELNIIFQPHRFERIKRYSAEFAEVLSDADKVEFFRPFAAWVDDKDVANPQTIIEKIVDTPVVYHDGDPAELADSITLESGKKQLFAILGAGDVSMVIPHLRNKIIKNYMAECLVIFQKNCPYIKFETNRPWRKRCSVRIGKATPLVARPNDIPQLQQLLAVATRLELAIKPLGNGSNFIGTDDDEAILFIDLNQGEFTRSKDDNYGSAILFPKLVFDRAAQGEIPRKAAPLGWIPATLGGAVRMNAGAHGVEISDYIKTIYGVSRNGKLWQANTEDINWSYRGSDIPNDVIVTSVEFSFPKDSTEAVLEEYQKVGEWRKANQPDGCNAGSTFKNPDADSAGRLLDVAGCKGAKVGGCQVSQLHANFIICEPRSKEEDYLELVLQIQRQVFCDSGIIINQEIHFAGSRASTKIKQQLKWLEAENNK